MKKVFIFLTILSLTYACSFLVAEGAFRLLGDKVSSDLGGLYESFSNGSYKLAPSVDTSASWSAGHFSVHTDSLGLRCDDSRRWAALPGTEIDALFLGDSQGFGNGVNFEDSLAGATAIALAENGYRVSNASVGGHALLNQFEIVKWLREERSLKVKNYIVFLTPVMIRNGEGFGKATVGEDGRLYNEPLGFLKKTAAWLKTHAVIYSRIRDAVRNCGIGTKPEAATPFVLQIYGDKEKEKEIEGSLLVSMQRVQDFASQYGAQLHFVYVPLTVEVDSSSLVSAASIRNISLDLDMPLRICTAVANQLKIPLYNFRPVLEQFQAKGEPLSLTADFHYNIELSRACALTLSPNLMTVLGEKNNALVQ